MSVLVALFAGGLTFSAALIVLTTQRRALVRDRLTPYLVGTSTAVARNGIPRASSVSVAAGKLLSRLGLYERVTQALAGAGLDLSAGIFACITAVVALCGLLVLFTAAGPVAALVGAVGGAVVPWLVLGVLARRRALAFERQLPDILDTLAASLKAGHGFDQAMQAVATEAADPAGREFRRIVAGAQLGRSLDDGLAELGARVKSADFRFVLDAIAIQRQVGGSMAGLFELVAEMVRAREEFRRKLKALTGMVRVSANVLTALPFLAALLLTIVNRRYMSPLWHTSTGHVLVLVAILMILGGGVVLRRVGAVQG